MSGKPDTDLIMLYQLLRVHQWAASDVQLSPSQSWQDE